MRVAPLCGNVWKYKETLSAARRVTYVLHKLMCLQHGLQQRIKFNLVQELKFCTILQMNGHCMEVMAYQSISSGLVSYASFLQCLIQICRPIQDSNDYTIQTLITQTHNNLATQVRTYMDLAQVTNIRQVDMSGKDSVE